MVCLPDCRNTEQAHLYASNIHLTNINMKDFKLKLTEEQYDILLKNSSLDTRDERIDECSSTINSELGNIENCLLVLQRFEVFEEGESVGVDYSLHFTFL